MYCLSTEQGRWHYSSVQSLLILVLQSRCEKDEKDGGPCLRCQRQSLPCHEDPFFRRASKSRYADFAGRYLTGQLIGATDKSRSWKAKFEPAWLQSTGAVDKPCPLTIHKDPFPWTKRLRLLQVQLSSLWDVLICRFHHPQLNGTTWRNAIDAAETSQALTF